MIVFNNGEKINAKVIFEGTICTIYTDQKPNTSGFRVNNFDCSDFIYLVRKNHDSYVLSNVYGHINIIDEHKGVTN